MLHPTAGLRLGAACAELHEKQAELWDVFSKEARTNKTLAPYWELLAMFDGQAEGDGESKEGNDAELVEDSNGAEEGSQTAEKHPHAAPVQVL